MNRVSTAVLALACLVTGFALAGTRVKALDDVSPPRFPSDISVGTRIVMSLDGPNGGTISCAIERMDAGWIKCATDEQDTFHPTVRPQWYAIAHVTDVEPVQPKR
jgi:hypothetical protein